jgi:hypothetical protein
MIKNNNIFYLHIGEGEIFNQIKKRISKVINNRNTVHIETSNCLSKKNKKDCTLQLNRKSTCVVLTTKSKTTLYRTLDLFKEYTGVSFIIYTEKISYEEMNNYHLFTNNDNDLVLFSGLNFTAASSYSILLQTKKEIPYAFTRIFGKTRIYIEIPQTVSMVKCFNFAKLVENMTLDCIKKIYIKNKSSGDFFNGLLDSDAIRDLKRYITFLTRKKLDLNLACIVSHVVYSIEEKDIKLDNLEIEKKYRSFIQTVYSLWRGEFVRKNKNDWERISNKLPNGIS